MRFRDIHVMTRKRDYDRDRNGKIMRHHQYLYRYNNLEVSLIYAHYGDWIEFWECGYFNEPAEHGTFVCIQYPSRKKAVLAIIKYFKSKTV